MAIEYIRDDSYLTLRPCRFTWTPKTYALAYVKPIACYEWRGVPASHIRAGLLILHLNPRRAHRLERQWRSTWKAA